MKKPILFTLLLSSLTIIAKAQEDFVYGVFSQQEISMKQYDKDTSAHAVVLNEFGRAKIDATNNDNIRLIVEYHVK